MQRTFFLYVVISECSPVFELFSRKDEPLLIQCRGRIPRLSARARLYLKPDP